MISLSSKRNGIIGIAGHVGCGHCHSLNNQVQDDSPGLAVVLSLFKKATNISLKIIDFIFEDNKVTAILENGGKGEAISRRGFTPFEKNIIKRLIGEDAINTHTIVLKEFGRIYGQGVLETPVAVQTAIANAGLNSFLINYPEHFIGAVEDIPNNNGNIVGTVLDIDGIPVSVLGTVNATVGGLGPNEDLEGNSPFYSKRNIIESLNMHKIPTLIIEAMIVSSFSKGLEQNTYFVRGDEMDDNPYVVEAVVNACKNLNLPIIYHKGGMKRTKNLLRENTKKVADKIVELGIALKNSELSEEKVKIIGDLALIISQDCGGISFMSNSLHEEIGGAGMIPKTSAVINLVATEIYGIENIIPFLENKELEEYINITLESIKELYKTLNLATKHIKA